MSFNPMIDTVKELKKMNEKLTEQLDQIVRRLDILIELEQRGYTNTTS